MKIYDETLQQYVEVSIKALDSMPIGSIIMFAGETIPTGWLICDGDTLNEEEYPELYDVIKYKYGGSGLDFNLPNFKGRVPVGLDSTQTEFDTLGETGGEKYHQLTINEMPQHDHAVYMDQDGTGGRWGPNGTSQQSTLRYSVTGGTGGNQAHNNLQPYLVVNYIIKVTNTTPTMASVVNATNNSTEDTYSCDYSNKHYGGVVLYDNTNGTVGNITLNDSVENYNYLEIEYNKDGYSKCTGKLSNYSSPMLDLFWYWYDSGRGIVVYENLCEIPTISGTTITRGDIYYTDIANNTIASGRGEGGTSIKISRVVGYK